jgi:hypothetical protein
MVVLCISWWCWLAYSVLALVMAGSAPGRADEGIPVSGSAFKICHDQTYALCAVASCFVFNGVAYCTCDVEHGDSISLPFNYDTGEDVCSVNAAGAGNGYMVSTFSVPNSVIAPRGDKALYTCPGATSTGAYAQCDGGLCFQRSTQTQTFPPDSATPLQPNQIICSCPITVADPGTDTFGYQIAGPYPCQRSFFENCSSQVSNDQTGTTIYVGAPTGTARLLARLLNGTVPPLNRCPSPAAAGP